MARPSEAYDFVMSFVANSQEFKDEYIDRWREILANFIVDPEEYSGGNKVDSPYVKGRTVHRSSGIILKDAETHKAIMTYASNLVLTVMGDRRGEFVKASPVGWEDSPGKAPTVTRLMRYAFNLPGFFRTMVEAVIDMLLFGTSVVEINWKYQEREQPVRSIDVIGGVPMDSFSRQRVVAWDDPMISVVDNQDFYPDPSESRIENMSGVARRFKTNALSARQMVDNGIWKEAAVERAIEGIVKAGVDQRPTHSDEFFRRGIDQPEHANQVDDFTPLVGVEYWGEVPWEDDQGSSRRVITIVNEEVVRDDPYPLADRDLPFRSLVINPVCGRFYGVSPAEVIRWDQSLQDAIKVLLAEAIIRSVHPPIAYEIDSEIDLNKLRRWSPDVPIGVRGGPSGVGTLRYDSNVFGAFSEMQALKTSMQEASGALAPLQGQGLGSKRASATEAGFAQQQSMNRPELAASLLERDALPLIATSLLRRYQQFVDEQGLAMRVGSMPDPVWIGDIMGDFDVQFLGSRIAISRQEKLQSIDRLVAMGAAIPQFAAGVPWQQMGSWMIGDILELTEIAASMGDQDIMKLNILLAQLMQQRSSGTGNGNGTTLGQQPQGALPSQTGGSIVS